MRKLFEYKSGSMMDDHYGEKDTAIITVGNFISGYSTYRNGTYDHMVFVHVQFGRINIRRGWSYESTRSK
jgi:hypothetical protein